MRFAQWLIHLHYIQRKMPEPSITSSCTFDSNLFCPTWGGVPLTRRGSRPESSLFALLLLFPTEIACRSFWEIFFSLLFVQSQLRHLGRKGEKRGSFTCLPTTTPPSSCTSPFFRRRLNQLLLRWKNFFVLLSPFHVPLLSYTLRTFYLFSTKSHVGPWKKRSGCLVCVCSTEWREF